MEPLKRIANFLNIKRLLFFKIRLFFVSTTVAILTLLYFYVLNVANNINVDVNNVSYLNGNKLINIDILKQVNEVIIDNSDNNTAYVVDEIVNSKELVDTFHLLNSTVLLFMEDEEEVFKIIIRGKGGKCLNKSCSEFECIIKSELNHHRNLLLPSGFRCESSQLPLKYKFLNYLSETSFIMVDAKNAGLIVNNHWQTKVDNTLATLSNGTNKNIFVNMFENILIANNLQDYSLIVTDFEKGSKEKKEILFSLQNKIVVTLCFITLPISLLFLILGQKKLIRMESGLRLGFGATKNEIQIGVGINSFVQATTISMLGIAFGIIVAISTNKIYEYTYLIDLSNILLFIVSITLFNGAISVLFTWLIIKFNIISLLRSK